MAAGRKAKAGRGPTRGARGAPAARARTARATSARARTPVEPVRLPRVSKGKRPQFHDSVAVDQLFAIVTALAAELSVAFDRLDTVERLLVANGVIAEDAVEAYQPRGAAAEARGARREALIQRVFAVFEAYGTREPL